MMLHVRVSVDAKCPRHPRRIYDEPTAGCGICQHLADAQRRAVQLEGELRAAESLGGELDWRELRSSTESPHSHTPGSARAATESADREAPPASAETEPDAV
jgi:hypothetical protein